MKRNKQSEVRKPTLGAYFTSPTEFETFHGILSRINQRSRLDVRILTYRKFLRSRPDCIEFVKNAGLDIDIRQKLLHRLIPMPWLKQVDALLVTGDPAWNKHKPLQHWIRTKYIRSSRLPTIYFQHGIVQLGINAKDNTLQIPIEFHSELIFFFEELAENCSMFSDASILRIHRSGFIKKLYVSQRASSIAEQFSKYQMNLLFAHSFRTHHNTQIEMLSYFRMLKEFALAHPRFAIILRPHRGVSKKWHAKFDNELNRDCPNVFFASRRNKYLADASMADLLAVTDILVSTPSTAVMEALYFGIPVAITLNNAKQFQGLPQVNDIDSLTDFVRDPSIFQNNYDDIRQKFGDLDQNIDNACEKIESYLLNLRSPGGE